MDEAGYGPNLGPLLITLTRWRTPEAPHRCQFYRLLKSVLDPLGHHDWKKLHVADSKLVFTGKEGFRSLETTALALLGCVGCDTRSFRSIWRHVAPAGSFVEEELPPWYHADICLPVAADADQVRRHTERLCGRLERCGLELVQIQSDLVIEERFNHLMGADGSNKASALSRLAFCLLRGAWSPESDCETLFIGDKHGGRNRYDDLLAEILDGAMIFRMEEGRALSRYRVGRTELRFQVGGEVHLPVACASIISKYLRELAMDLINQFWEQHCPGVKPTRGYPGDARRFREDVEAARVRLEIAEHVFWRAR